MINENNKIPYEILFNEIPCYITVQDKNLKIIQANRRFKENFGDKIGEFCYKAYKNKDSKCEFCPVEKTFQNGHGHSKSEEILTCKDGRSIPVLVYTTPLYNNSGEVEAVMEVSTNILELKRLQNLLTETNERYRQLFEEVPCYISIQDRNLKIIESNRRFKEDFGDNNLEYCYKQYKHRDEQCIICPVLNTFETGKVNCSEEIVTNKKGETKHVIVYTSPIRNYIGDITHVMEMSTDITQIRELESQLTSLGLLVGSIAHSIKGLLQGLDGGIYILETGLNKNNVDRMKEGWEMIQRNIDKIRRMVQDVLYYAKDREPEYETINIKILCDEVYKIIKDKIIQFKIIFNLNIDSFIEEFQADPNAIQSMLINILMNSIDACRIDKKKSSHKIDFSITGDNENIIFKISDNGIGIDQETKEKLFTLFFSSKGMEGTGLGLFVSNKIVQKHNGTIEVDSIPNKGTTFIIRLPKVKPPSKQLIVSS